MGLFVVRIAVVDCSGLIGSRMSHRIYSRAHWQDYFRHHSNIEFEPRSGDRLYPLVVATKDATEIGLSSQYPKLGGCQVTLRRRAAHEEGKGNEADHAHNKDHQDVA